MCLFFIYIKYKWLKFQKGECKFEIDSFWNSFNIVLPIVLQFSITAVGSVILQSAVNTLGSDIVAAVNATMKVQMIMTQPMEVIGTSLATFSGQNMGAGKIDRIKEGVKKALIMTIICALAAMLIGNLLVQPMSYLFMRSDELTIGILSNIRLLLFCNSCFYIPLGTLMVFRNTLQGAGYSLAAMSAGV